jgi:hypothetical protein
MDEGEPDEGPDEDKLDRKDEVDRAAAGSGEGFEESVPEGCGYDMDHASPGGVEGRQGETGMAFEGEELVLVAGDGFGETLEGRGEKDADGGDCAEEEQGAADGWLFHHHPHIDRGQEEDGDGAADPDDEQEAEYTINNSFPGESASQQAVYIINQEADEHVEHAFAVDTGRPEQGGGEQEYGEGGQGIVGEAIAEHAEEGDVTEEDREGEQEGIGVQVVPGEGGEDDMDKGDGVVGEEIPVGVVFPEEVEIVEEPVSFGGIELEIHPDISVFGIEIPGDEIVEAADGDMEEEKEQQGSRADLASPGEFHFYHGVAAENSIQDQQDYLHRQTVLTGSTRVFLFYPNR